MQRYSKCNFLFFLNLNVHVQQKVENCLYTGPAERIENWGGGGGRAKSQLHPPPHIFVP